MIPWEKNNMPKIDEIKINMYGKENYNKGWNDCGFKVIAVIEKHYEYLTREFIEDIEHIFNT